MTNYIYEELIEIINNIKINLEDIYLLEKYKNQEEKEEIFNCINMLNNNIIIINNIDKNIILSNPEKKSYNRLLKKINQLANYLYSSILKYKNKKESFIVFNFFNINLKEIINNIILLNRCIELIPNY